VLSHVAGYQLPYICFADTWGLKVMLVAGMHPVAAAPPHVSSKTFLKMYKKYSICDSTFDDPQTLEAEMEIPIHFQKDI